jgi:8-oxo-dGTP pyrophosphatase MutT (NUDIX family)
METQNPPPLRDAATVILVRGRETFFETYLLRRSTKSGFMGGLYVFPGGTVDTPDRGTTNWLPFIDLPAKQVEQQLGTTTFDLDSAVAFGVAAIRETLEEAGVFIASFTDKSESDFARAAGLRLKKKRNDDWFGNLIRSEKWTLLFSHLGPWSHWITPERMNKRFDTRFFIVPMPDHQQCVPDNLETKHGIWLSPMAALKQNLSGQTPLSPPAVVTLTELSRFRSLSDLMHHMASRPWGDPISPVMLPSNEGPVIIEPWDHQFETPEAIRLKNLSKKELPPGESFSRIWCDRGQWKPIAHT